MPKKHAPNYIHTKPSYVHPSLQSSKSSTSSTPASPPTVNERIQQLRREQAPKATSSRSDEVTELVTHGTLPPELRRILHMAEVNPPLPKPGTRTRIPRVGPRPPPGPAAPTSWLSSSRHAPHHIRNLRKYRIGEGHGPSRFCALAQLHDSAYKRLPPARSLVHQCLKTFATHWEELAEYEQHYLPALPVQMKEALLSYLSLYGAKGCLDLKSLKILFGSGKEVEGGSGSEEIRFLDFTGLLSQSYTLADLNKSLTRSFPSTTVTGGIAQLSLGDTKRKAKAPVEVIESWEDEADDTNTTPTLSSTLSVPIFPSLTRLSLAHPGSNASWSDLLTLSTKLKTLTHLSLAYWPTPSMTPNATTTSMVSNMTKPIALGGSHFYSELDDDWHEAANILRRLSQNTYCLKWLDLEGCTWHKALTWDSGFSLQADRFDRDDRNNWTASISSPGPDWNTSWRQIEYLNLFQGWLPSDRRALQAMPAGAIQWQLLSWLREHGENEEQQMKMRGDTGHAVSEWVEREKVARTVAFGINQTRKAGGAKHCVVDHGWEKVATVPRRKDEVVET